MFVAKLGFTIGIKHAEINSGNGRAGLNDQCGHARLMAGVAMLELMTVVDVTKSNPSLLYTVEIRY